MQRGGAVGRGLVHVDALVDDQRAHRIQVDGLDRRDQRRVAAHGGLCHDRDAETCDERGHGNQRSRDIQALPAVGMHENHLAPRPENAHPSMACARPRSVPDG